MQRTNGAIEARGLSMRYAETKGGPPAVVAIHSSGMSSRQWLRLALDLEARRARCVAPDLFGYGESDAWPDANDFPIDADVDAIVALIDAVGGPCFLVGHSFGGFLALRAAAARPDAVSGIVVHEPVAWGTLREVEPATVERAFHDIDRDGLFFDPVRGGSEAWFERFVGFWMGEGAWRALPARQHAAMLAHGRQTFLEVRALCLDRTPAAAWRPIRCPVAITCGEASPTLEVRVCELVTTAIAGATLTRLPGGHMSPITHADEFHRVVFETLDRATP